MQKTPNIKENGMDLPTNRPPDRHGKALIGVTTKKNQFGTLINLPNWIVVKAISLDFAQDDITSNGGYRREEKNHKHWSLFTMLFIFSYCNFFFICEIKSRAIVCIECTENPRKIGLSQMSSMS